MLSQLGLSNVEHYAYFIFRCSLPGIVWPTKSVALIHQVIKEAGKGKLVGLNAG